MAQFRIICRPSQNSPLDTTFEVEELAPYMSPNGECIATYWALVAGPFDVLDYAEIYVEHAIAMAAAGRFVVKEYDAPTGLQNKATELPDFLRVGDIWEFETEVKERGRMKPRTMQWRVVQWHAGELAWQLQSLDGKHFTYLMACAPQYEDMKFIGTEKTP
jgi:hypothetical protein